MNDSYFVGEHLYLRPMEPEDLELLYTVENDTSMWDVANSNVPYSRFALKQYIENSQCDMFADKQLRMIIARKSDNEALGMIDVTDFSPMHARAEVGISILTEHRNRGYGREAVNLLCDYAFGFLSLKQLTVHISVSNAASRKMFRACGFEECGLLKEWWRTGDRFTDVVLLQRLNRDTR